MRKGICCLRLILLDLCIQVVVPRGCWFRRLLDLILGLKQLHLLVFNAFAQITKGLLEQFQVLLDGIDRLVLLHVLLVASRFPMGVVKQLAPLFLHHLLHVLQILHLYELLFLLGQYLVQFFDIRKSLVILRCFFGFYRLHRRFESVDLAQRSSSTAHSID